MIDIRCVINWIYVDGFAIKNTSHHCLAISHLNAAREDLSLLPTTSQFDI